MASAATDAAKSSLQQYQALGSDTALNTGNSTYDVAGSQTRLSALKGIVGNLQSSVEAVDPSVTGRTSGTFTTEGQRQALVSKERAPIMGDLNKQQGALTSEQGDLTQKQTLASQMASALLSDDKSKYQRLLDQYNASTAQDSADEQKRQFEASSAESKRQYDASQAEGKRQFDISSRNAAAKSAASSTASSTAGYNAKAGKNGGAQFSYKGAPITAAQYYSAIGNSNDLVNFLKNDKNSAAAYKDYTSGKYTYDQLAKKYSYIFGGV